LQAEEEDGIIDDLIVMPQQLATPPLLKAKITTNKEETYHCQGASLLLLTTIDLQLS
jgi:hypothetical protein